MQLWLAVMVELKSVSVLISPWESCTNVWSPEAHTHTARQAWRAPTRGTRPGIAYHTELRSRGSSGRGRPSWPFCEPQSSVNAEHETKLNDSPIRKKPGSCRRCRARPRG